MDFELIAKYLSGEATTEEETRLTAFRQASAQNEAEFREMASLWMYSGEIPGKEDAGKLYARHRRLILLKRHSLRILRYAAMLALIAGAWWAGGHSGSSGVAPGEILVKTRPGQHSEIILPDSSHVWLNASSTLAYPSDFSNDKRNVRLIEGEALFQVSKSDKEHFIVSTADIDVKVFGTRFTVSNRPDERETGIALLEGSVEVLDKSGRRLAEMRPGERFSHDRLNGENKLTADDLSACGIWHLNEMKIRNRTLPEVISLMEEWYGVNISLEGKYSTGELYWMTVKTESLKEMLGLMARITPMEYEIEGKNITLHLKQ